MALPNNRKIFDMGRNSRKGREVFLMASSTPPTPFLQWQNQWEEISEQIIHFTEPPTNGEPVPLTVERMRRMVQELDTPADGYYDPDMPGMTLEEIRAWVKKEEAWQKDNL